jgi:hypothetical protein
VNLAVEKNLSHNKMFYLLSNGTENLHTMHILPMATPLATAVLLTVVYSFDVGSSALVSLLAQLTETETFFERIEKF